VNETHGYVLLQRTTTSIGKKPKFRFHNASLLMKYIVGYIFLSVPLRLIATTAARIRSMSRTG
jgi:hypothetical protein